MPTLSWTLTIQTLGMTLARFLEATWTEHLHGDALEFDEFVNSSVFVYCSLFDEAQVSAAHNFYAP